VTTLSGTESAHDLRAAAELLSGAPDVTLLCHRNPDADTFGSAIALGLALRDRGATVRVSFAWPDAVPESLAHLDPAGLYVPAAEIPAAPALLVALDTGHRSQLGDLADRVAATRAAGGSVLVIDHHRSDNKFGTHHVVDVTAEATTVLVLRLLDELGVELTEPVARGLYAGLLTDTSSFRRATADTHRMAARLLAAGVDANAVARPLLDVHPFGWLRMLSAVLDRTELEPAAAHGLGLVHTTVTLSDAAGLRQEEVESVINIIRTSAEAEVAAVLKESAPGTWTASLRAVGSVDVGAAAGLMGGGGHRFASGFTTDGTPEEIIDRLRAALDQAPLVG
jgi:phosphoesterase RecJ-like protein